MHNLDNFSSPDVLAHFPIWLRTSARTLTGKMIFLCQLLCVFSPHVASAEYEGLEALQILNSIRGHVEGVPFPNLLDQVQDQSTAELAGSGNNQARQIFQRYVKARIRRVPLAHREQVERALQIENMKLEYVDTRSRQSNEALVHGELNHGGVTGKIMLRLPIELEGTFLDYAIRVHELEHLIQFLHLGGQFVEHERPEHVDFVFEAEKGAMLAEAVYLLAIPRQTLHNGHELIDSVPHLSHFDKNFLKGVLGGAHISLTPEDYVQHQWQTVGRYTRAYIEARAERERSLQNDSCEDFLGSIVRIWKDLF